MQQCSTRKYVKQPSFYQPKYLYQRLIQFHTIFTASKTGFREKRLNKLVFVSVGVMQALRKHVSDINMCPQRQPASLECFIYLGTLSPMLHSYIFLKSIQF